MWWLRLIVFAFGGAEALALLCLLYWGWIHQNDWSGHCERVRMWQQHFRENVPHSWIFFDGSGT